MAHTKRHTHTYGHGNSMTNPAQRAESVKKSTWQDFQWPLVYVFNFVKDVWKVKVFSQDEDFLLLLLQISFYLPNN